MCHCLHWIFKRPKSPPTQPLSNSLQPFILFSIPRICFLRTTKILSDTMHIQHKCAHFRSIVKPKSSLPQIHSAQSRTHNISIIEYIPKINNTQGPHQHAHINILNFGRLFKSKWIRMFDWFVWIWMDWIKYHVYLQSFRRSLAQIMRFNSNLCKTFIYTNTKHPPAEMAIIICKTYSK